MSYDFKKGEYLRLQFACRLSAQGVIVTVAPRKGTFQPWWKLLSIEVYGAAKPYSGATVTALDHPGALPISTNFDAEHHRVTALVNDDPKGTAVAADILRVVGSAKIAKHGPGFGLDPGLRFISSYSCVKRAAFCSSQTVNLEA